MDELKKLQMLLEDDSLEVDSIRQQINMKYNEKLLKAHPYKISKLKDGRYGTYVKTKKGRRNIKAPTKEALCRKLIEFYSGCEPLDNTNLDDIFEDWKRAVSAISSNLYPENFPQEIFQKSKSDHSDPTALYGRYFAVYTKNIELVERVAAATDAELKHYILAAVTLGRSFKYLDGVMHIPCGKDMYYDRYRRFFYLLSREKTY